MAKTFTQNISYDHMLDVYDLLQSPEDFNSQYEEEKHRIHFIDTHDYVFGYLRLPVSLNYHYINAPVKYVLVLIQTGDCAMGVFQDDACLQHKVFKSYMVRKKHGKSQLKYLKTKGKSKAGSRVRLGNTVDFFENINTRLSHYLEDHTPDRIAISCPKTLWPFLFQSKVPCPFDKDDPRLYKIPLYVPKPKLEVLYKINRSLQGAELVAESDHPHFEKLLKLLDIAYK